MAWGSNAGDSSTAPKSGAKKEATISDCAQDCLYQQANEGIGIQAIYQFQKLVEISQNRDAVRRNLQCFAEDVEDDGACFRRHKDLTLIELYRLRASLLQNNDSMVRLNSKIDAEGKKTASVPPMVGRLDDGSGGADSPPHVIGFKDLAELDAQRKSLSKKEREERLKGIPKGPEEKDYLVMKEFARDPDNLKAGSYTAIDAKNPIDKKAYKSDRERYWKAEKLKELEEYRKQMASQSGTAQKPAPKGKFQDSVGAESKEAFRKSRAQFVSSLNGLIQNRGIQSKQVTDFSKDAGKKVSSNDPTAKIKEDDQPLRSAGTPGVRVKNSVYLDPNEILSWIKKLEGLELAEE